MLHNDLALLKPAMHSRVEAALDAMNGDESLRSMGVERVAAAETLRDLAVQMAYFSRGRMEPKYVRLMYEAAGLYAITDNDAKTIITMTLRSKHLTGLACDLVPWKNGGIWWNAPPAVWERMGAIGKENGLVWGILVGKSVDSPHYEFPGA